MIKTKLATVIITLCLGSASLFADSQAEINSILRDLHSPQTKKKADAKRKLGHLLVVGEFSKNISPNSLLNKLEIEVMSNPDLEVQNQIISGLSQSKSPQSAHILERRARKAGHDIARLQAIEALGTVSGISARPVLSDLLNNESDVYVRLKAAKQLAVLGDKSGAPLAAKSIGDPNPYVRSEAAKALGAVGETSAIPALSKLVESNDQASFEAFEAINQIQLANTPVSAQLDFLKKALFSGTAACGWSARELARIRSREAVQVLLDAARAHPLPETREEKAKGCAEPIFVALYWDGTPASEAMVKAMLTSGVVSYVPK